jgi:hypothetical protein
VDPILLFAESWWWVAPVAAGAGATAYGALTTKRRRARRLELDAARHEDRLAYRALHDARAQTRVAKADVLTAKAQQRQAPAAMLDARRALAAARDSERAAALTLRASRSRLKVIYARYRTTPRSAPLPIEQLVARHDAVTARWLEYETDAALALSFPQMLDSQHPSTLAFLRAQRDAQTLRGAAVEKNIAPETYLAYRNAVQEAETKFAAAEADARGEVRESVAGLSWTNLTPLTEWLPRAADAIGNAARVVAEVREAVPPRRTDPPRPNTDG